MRIYRILSIQVPHYWDLVKFVLSEVEGIPTEHADGVFNRVFAKLMCSKMQCFVLMDDKEITGLVLTELFEHEVTTEGTLNVRALYSFQEDNEKIWKKAFGLVNRFAKKERCSKIRMEFKSPEILDLAKANRYEEVSKVMELRIGD